MAIKDRQNTERQILEAVGTLLSREGFAAVGVNSVAREAGVDKVLIYRYFGGLQGLLEAFVEQGDHWPDAVETFLAGAVPHDELAPGATAACCFLTGHLREMRRRELTREIMCWELVQKSPLAEMIARKRESQSNAMFPDGAPDSGMKTDVAAVAAIIHAGITYLNLRSRLVDVYMGVDLTSDDGFKRLENAICDLVSSWTSAHPDAEAFLADLYRSVIGDGQDSASELPDKKA